MQAFYLYALSFFRQQIKFIPKGGCCTQRLNKLFITALFSAIIFVANAFLPTPLNYMMIVVQAVILALSGLFIKGGATYVGAIGGLLRLLAGSGLGAQHWDPSLSYSPFCSVCLWIACYSSSESTEPERESTKKGS